MTVSLIDVVFAIAIIALLIAALTRKSRAMMQADVNGWEDHA